MAAMSASASTSTGSPANAIAARSTRRFNDSAPNASAADRFPGKSLGSAPSIITPHTRRISHAGDAHAGSLLCAGKSSVSVSRNATRSNGASRGKTNEASSTDDSPPRIIGRVPPVPAVVVVVVRFFTPNARSTLRRPSALAISSPSALNASLTSVKHAADPPTSVSSNASPTTLSYPGIARLACTGAELATAAWMRCGYFTRAHPASIPG